MIIVITGLLKTLAEVRVVLALLIPELWWCPSYHTTSYDIRERLGFLHSVFRYLCERILPSCSVWEVEGRFFPHLRTLPGNSYKAVLFVV